MEPEFDEDDDVELTGDIYRLAFDEHGEANVNKGGQATVTGKHTTWNGEREYDVTVQGIWGDQDVKRVKEKELKENRRLIPYKAPHKARSGSNRAQIHVGSSITDSVFDAGSPVIILVIFLLGAWFVPVVLGLITWGLSTPYYDNTNGVYGFMAWPYWLAGTAVMLFIGGAIGSMIALWNHGLKWSIGLISSFIAIGLAMFFWNYLSPTLATQGMIQAYGKSSVTCPSGNPTAAVSSLSVTPYISQLSGSADPTQFNYSITGTITNPSDAQIGVGGVGLYFEPYYSGEPADDTSDGVGDIPAHSTKAWSTQGTMSWPTNLKGPWPKAAYAELSYVNPTTSIPPSTDTTPQQNWSWNTVHRKGCANISYLNP
jgi:hypothetical protein